MNAITLQKRPQSDGPPISKRLMTFTKLNNGIALNEYGLPKAIYQPDFIPEDLYERPANEQAEILTLSAVEVAYAEGLPVVDGVLIWENIPWEPASAYAYFSDYIRLQKDNGYRSLNLLLANHPTLGDNAIQQLQANQAPFTIGSRPWHVVEDQIKQVQSERAKFITELREYYVFYCWGIRSAAFDLVAHVAYERLRERRAIETENYQYIETTKLLKKFEGIVEKVLNDSDKVQDLSIPDAIKTFKTLAELQRVSAGMPAAAPIPITEQYADNSPHGQSMQTRMKHQAKRQAALEENETKPALGIEQLVDDPHTLAMAQELIIQMGKKQATADGTNIKTGHTVRASDEDEVQKYQPQPNSAEPPNEDPNP